ncbi:metal ABC transporter solute-binding protein, Zn/Mn family [Cellulomonas sp. PhB150]|uniref:metal ABC transporter solute-binding protein, Zn/Mn family n=1 Tax=Cellulomonas sp. PhB150 TaxID=2485188 RepID=UPI000F476A31|nr:zinc ABC transporter substrate-binding protein [Cellulomonas sp. PhB150]ROS31313.1 zinc/manganese transport system substrate-binding protein [Cellulomonas sp. PhB150]
MKKSLALVVATTAALALSACSSSDSDPGGAATGTVAVVTSTNVYGDIAAQVGGDLVHVTAIIDDPSADPHSYEASAQTQLALSRAALVVENGGGYDDFVDTMLDAISTEPVVVNAVEVSGKDTGGDLNEHVWYDFPTVRALAGTIADELSSIDADNAATYAANATAFQAKVDDLIAETDAIKAEHAGAGVAITEPVPLYLLENAGLVNKTPEAFSEAIEEETDVPPAALKDTIALFSSHAVDALVYNSQTTGTETERVLSAAKDAGVPVVPVTETMPEGRDYVSWMTANIDAVRSALAS